MSFAETPAEIISPSPLTPNKLHGDERQVSFSRRACSPRLRGRGGQARRLNECAQRRISRFVTMRIVLEHTHTNRLANETSPYLLQHQHNPVDWYAWGEEAFERARREDKP